MERMLKLMSTTVSGVPSVTVENGVATINIENMGTLKDFCTNLICNSLLGEGNTCKSTPVSGESGSTKDTPKKDTVNTVGNEEAKEKDKDKDKPSTPAIKEYTFFESLLKLLEGTEGIRSVLTKLEETERKEKEKPSGNWPEVFLATLTNSMGDINATLSKPAKDVATSNATSSTLDTTTLPSYEESKSSTVQAENMTHTQLVDIEVKKLYDKARKEICDRALSESNYEPIMIIHKSWKILQILKEKFEKEGFTVREVKSSLINEPSRIFIDY